MNRRKFIQASALSTALPATVLGHDHTSQDPQKEVFEIRVYDMAFARNAQLLINYLSEQFQEFLAIRSCALSLFEEIGQSQPRKIYAMIRYTDIKTYLEVQMLAGTHVFSKSADDFHQLPSEEAPYNRFSSWLLSAFDGLPNWQSPIDNASVFELRTYEAYSLHALQRKIRMFNIEEIDLFNRLDLRPVFFGEMLAGPFRPCLTYMLNFKDMSERDSNWQTFVKHPEWKAMAGKEEYANTVSNIRKIFLKPI